MIVTTADDVVRLSGPLVKNQWLTIKAAAKYLLENHPQGIIINCSELTHVSEEGAKTFLQAMKEIQAAGARIVVSNLPEDILQVIRSVPTVRSQLPIATTEEDARASLRMCGVAPAGEPNECAMDRGIVVPLLPGLDADYALAMADRIARETRAAIHLVFLLEVGRNLALTSPLVEEEAAGNDLLSSGVQVAKKQGLLPATHIERVRDLNEGLLQVLRNYKATHVVIGAVAEQVGQDRFQEMVEVLLRRAPCGVIIGRKALDSNGFVSNGGPPIEV